MRKLALLLLAVPSAALAAPDAAPVAPPLVAMELPSRAFTKGPVRADARSLAQVLVPQDLYLGLAERSVIAGFDHGAAQDLAELDKDHPGLGDAVRAELVKAMRSHVEAGMPALHDRYARAIGEQFDAAEVAELMGFYKSRTGQKLILGKFSGMDLSNMLQKFDANPDAAITASDISSINKSAFAKIAPQLDEADKVALLGFMQLAAFRKLAGFNATLTALETQIASEPDPVLDQKIERAVQSALARFGIGEEPS